MKMMIKKIIKSVVILYHQVFTNQASLTPDKRFFFVHIPKTAGTSFRGAFELTAVTYKDYKNNPRVFSKPINQFIYKDQNFYGFKQLFLKHNVTWITGHVKLAKYIDLVPVTHTITFMRQPMERVISQYQHHVRYHGFTEDLSTFITLPISKNIQSKYVEFMPLNLIGNVGITEKYNDSLFLINQQFGLALSSKSKNTNTKSKTSFDFLDESIKNIIVKNNSRDIELYHEALFLHQARMQFFEKNKTWTYGCVTINGRGVLQGCAFQYNNDTAINLNITINNEIVSFVVAHEFYTFYAKANFPRERYIGFNFILPKNLTFGDEIDVYVQETEQKLNFKPLRIKQ